MSDEQLHVQQPLELADRGGERGLGEVDPLGDGGQGPLLRDDGEVRELAEGDGGRWGHGYQ